LGPRFTFGKISLNLYLVAFSPTTWAMTRPIPLTAGNEPLPPVILVMTKVDVAFATQRSTPTLTTRLRPWAARMIMVNIRDILLAANPTLAIPDAHNVIHVLVR
jgi:hypothetical protein